MENGITKLSVAGFKSIAQETTLDMKPLTLLAGTNSSGKSSFMQPLLLLKQTLETSYDPGPLLLDGKNVKFTSFEQLLTLTGEKNPKKEFFVTLEIALKMVHGTSPEPFSNTLTLFFSKKSGAITVSVQGGFFNARIDSDMRSAKLLEAIKTDGRFWSEEILGNGQIELEIVRRYCFLSIDAKKNLLSLNLWNTELFSKFIEKIIHVPALRGAPERSYQVTGVGPAFPGRFDHYTASVIAQWGEKKSDKLGQLCDALSHLGLTSKVLAKRLNDAQIEVQVGRLPKNGRTKSDMVNIADVGFGVSQTLPVLVALLVAEPGQLIYLEQPEIHLHPRAQVALAEILVDAANRGVKVVAETHSSLLLLAVQTLIAKQKISHEDVALHWFERDKTGMSTVTTAELDDSGRFGEWPVDFSDVELETEGEYIEVVSQQAFRYIEDAKGSKIAAPQVRKERRKHG